MGFNAPWAMVPFSTFVAELLAGDDLLSEEHPMSVAVSKTVTTAKKLPI